MHDSSRAQTTILLVDDNLDALFVLRYALENAGLTVLTAHSGSKALSVVEEHGVPHLAILDLNMPGMDGFALAERLHEFSDLPVIMLSAMDETKTVVDGLQQHAEDYVVKPCNPNELLARIRRVLKRVGHFYYDPAVPVPVDGYLQIDFPNRRAHINGKSVSLTPTETRLLYLLMRTPAETIPSDYLLRRMWPLELAAEDRLHVYVHRLRRKLRKGRTGHDYIISERGVGYAFHPADGSG